MVPGAGLTFQSGKQLEEAGYVTLAKAAKNGRQRTWITLTTRGRKAFASHVAELQRLAAMTAPTPMGQGFAG